MRLIWVAVLFAATAHAASLALDKQPVLLGKTESVGVTITLDEPQGAEVRPLRIAVNVGSFSPVQRKGPGKYTTTYVPPATRFPQVALIAVWRETGPEAPIEFLRIPLYGSTKLPVGAKPGSEVTVEVGDLSFGPVKVDRDGKVEVPISVPPGVSEVGAKVKDPRGGIGNKKIAIEVPPYNRVTAALVPHAIVADGQSEARLDVFYDLGGAKVPPSNVKVTASIGEVRLERAEKGRYVYRYRPPQGASAPNVEFGIAVSGDPTAKASATLMLGQPPPDKLVLRPPQTKLRADGASKAKVEVIVFDEAGLGVANQPVRVAANGVGLGLPTYRGNGLYEFDYVAPEEFPPGGLVQFIATDDKLSGAANYQLVAPSAPSEVTARVVPDPIPADGHTDAVVHFDVRDAAGLPLPGARLLAVASHGTLGPLSDDGEGRYSAHLQAPDSVPDGKALIRLVDSTGTFEQKVELSMREDPKRLLIGVRGGFTHSLQELMGARGGLDVSLSVRLGPVLVWLSALAQVGYGRQSITEGLSTLSQVWFVPLQARVAAELWAGRRLSLVVGAGGGATWARYTTTLTGRIESAWGPGVGGFAALNLAAGPGHLFLEAGYTYSPVAGESFRVETGGVGLALGYRLGVL